MNPSELVRVVGVRPDGTRVILWESTASDVAAPAPGNAMDRARGLQDTLSKESAKRGGDQ